MQAAVSALQTLRVLAAAAHPGLAPALAAHVGSVAAGLSHESAAVQYAAAACAAALAQHHTAALLPLLLTWVPNLMSCCRQCICGVPHCLHVRQCSQDGAEDGLQSHLMLGADCVLTYCLLDARLKDGCCRHVLPLLHDGSAPRGQAGAAVLLSRLVQVLGADLAAYAVLLVVPLMPLVSTPDPATREAAAGAFASLVALLPIALVRCSFTVCSGAVAAYAFCPLLQST